jgi:hypothetical protein
MNKALLSLSLGLVLALALRSQSVADLNAKYPVVTSYEVRPGILMIPRYTDDGQVCEMSFARQHTTRSGLYLDSRISNKLANDIANELAPPATRGDELHGPPHPSGMDVTTGRVHMTVYNYENLEIMFAGLTGEYPGVDAVVISWKNDRKCKDESKVLPLEQYPH